MMPMRSSFLTASSFFVAAAQSQMSPPAMTMRQKTMRPGDREMSLPKTPVHPASRIERWS